MRRYLFWILLFALSVKAYAGGDTTSVQHFNIEKGLPSNNVYSAVEDAFGYIWFATDNGLVKYNGYTSKIFTTANGLPTNDVWKLYLDKRGRMWVHTHTYKIGYIKNDQYKTVITSPNRIIYPSYIASDKQKTYFFYNEGNQLKLATVDSNDNVLSTDINNPALLSNNCVLWLQSINGFYNRNLSSGDSNFKKSCTLSGNGHNISFTSNSTGIFHNTIYNFSFLNDYAEFINLNNCSLKKIDFSDIKGEKNESIYTSYVYNDSLILITSKTVYVFDSNFNIVEKTNLSSYLPSSSQAAYFFRDKFRNTWFTTNGDGAYCKLRTSGIFHVNESLNELTNTKLVGTIKDGSSFWWQKENTTLYVLDTSKHINKIYFPKNTLLRGVSTVNDSEVFLCFNQSLSIYNTSTKKVSNFINQHHIKTVVYVSTYNNTSSHVEHDSMLMQKYLSNKTSILPMGHDFFIKGYVDVSVAHLSNDTIYIKSLEQERYTDMLYDAADNLFILYNVDKLSIFNPVNNKIITLNPDLLSNIKINSISAAGVDRFSNLYILDNEKIMVYNIKTMRTRYIAPDFNFIDAHLKVYNDHLILAGIFGLSYAQIKGPLSLGNFYVVANAKNSYYSRLYSLTVSNTGDINLHTDKGIFNMNMNSLLTSNSVFNPASDEFFKLTLNAPYQTVLKSNDTIVIDQKYQKINLDAINFFGTGSVQFSYYIDRYNTSWQQSASGEMYIGDIKPNIYYTVNCNINDNSWKNKKVTFYLYVRPYWYQTHLWRIIFWICGILLILGSLLLVILLTRHIVARSNQKKRMLTELELRAVYAQINPHFVFNTLSAALYFINKKRFDDAYTHVNKFSRLIRAYLKSSQDRYILLSEEIEMLTNYIDLQRTRFEGKFDFDIEIDNKIPTQNIKIPSLLLQPLVENAINHGLFHKGEQGLLQLKFIQGATGDELICIIDDNGVGRDKAKEIKKTSSARQESYGTKLTQQLIEIFKEYENMDIELEYIDKQSPDTGTTVKITIKNIKYVA